MGWQQNGIFQKTAFRIGARRPRWSFARLIPVMATACVAVGTASSSRTRPAVTGTAAAATVSASNTTGSIGAFSERAMPAVPHSSNAPPEASLPRVMPDVDYWATPQPVVDRMLELAKVKASDVIYDLGCGDARSLITAAERYGAKGVGFDIDPRLVAEARENVQHRGVEGLVRIEQANIFDLDLSGADVIFLYITPRFNLRLVPQLEKMRRGSRIVAHEFEIPGAKPARVVKVPGPPDGPPDAEQHGSNVMHTIFVWFVPWKKQPTDWKTD